ncbi:MAG: hypothetical protein K9K38_08910 [Rhodoferax sp.]|nr:hypothetical protein [Rhodoferax sp.]MCF8209508.1 hypothetical protein [Rhodoferax sp.]
MSLPTLHFDTSENTALLQRYAALFIDSAGLPFDVARAQYARAVETGLLPRSMLATRDFTRALSAVERLTLGPWARHV